MNLSVTSMYLLFMIDEMYLPAYIVIKLYFTILK